MRYAILIMVLLSVTLVSGTPFSENGKLHICGTKVCNQNNVAIQLRGVGTHGMHWFQSCYTDAAIRSMSDDWGADVLRISTYPNQGGYQDDPAYWRAFADRMVEAAYQEGIYVILDWHMGMAGDDGGDPMYWVTKNNMVVDFFDYMSKKHGAKGNIIYELSNEPHDVDWNRIKSYSELLIDKIRANDPDSIIIVASPDWAQRPDFIDTPITGARAKNVAYSVHFYMHGEDRRQIIRQQAERLPLFATEWGGYNDGTGEIMIDNGKAWVDTLGELQIGWSHWGWCDGDFAGWPVAEGACSSGSYAPKPYGDELLIWLNQPVDNWGNTMACSGFCCQSGSTCSQTQAGTCSSGTCCASQSACTASSLTCSSQGFYCCPASSSCSDPKTASGCASGLTCCGSQSACQTPVLTCSGQGYYCCPAGNTCSNPQAGTGCTGTCCASAAGCAQISVMKSFRSGNALVDGILSEYTGTGTAIGQSHIVSGQMTSTSDISAIMHSAWTPTDLFIAIEVTDDTVKSDSANIYDDDAVEIYIDGKNDRTSTYGNDDLQIVIGSDGRILFARDGMAVAAPIGAKQMVKASQGGYIAEISIPFSALGISPATSARIGFDFGIDDDDDGGGPDAQLIYSSSLDGWIRPAVFGNIELVQGMSPADTDKDNCISMPELSAYITQWRNGQVALASLMEAIRLWKSGC
jgi:hypothetical protein